MRDLTNSIKPVRVLSPGAGPSDNTAQVGQIVNMAGFSSATYIIQTGSIADADATFAVLLEESDASDMTGAAAVADADLIGTEALAGFVFSDDNKCFKLGYAGTKRYHRLTITPSGNASAAAMSAVCILGHPRSRPTSNPPA